MSDRSDRNEERRGRKEAILVLDYEGQGQDEADGLRTDAQNIKNRLEGADKQRVVTLFESEEAFQAWMGKSESRDLTKIHIVAHGNQECCGPYNPQQLATFIGRCIAGKAELKFITLHSCCAGEPHPETEEIFVRQFASALLPCIKGKGNSDFITVRGSNGESWTDSVGRNWVLKQHEKRIRNMNRDDEKRWIRDKTKSRGTSRPKFGIYNFSEYQDVQDL